MHEDSRFDAHQGHRHFSADCFNRTWDLIEKPQRSPADHDAMRSLCHASLWHWTQREDCTERNMSIAYWQLSRVYALLGRADDARRYGELCLHYSQREPPFYLGYAHEALARAAAVAGDAEQVSHHLAKARQLAADVADAEERSALESDLETIC